MADTDLQQQTLMVAGAGDTTDTENKLREVTVQEVQVNESGEISAADILQQAFQEASEGYEQVAVAYATVEDGVTVLHGTIPEGVLQQVSSGQTIQQVTLTDVVNGTNTAEGQEVVEQIPPPEQPGEPAQNNDAQGALVESLTEFVADNVTGQSILIPRGTQIVSEAPAEEEPQEERQQEQPQEEETPASVRIQPVSTSSFQHISLPPKQTTAPLGSSENPIQIIQQGNTYHSTQVLSSEQLQQIAHVLQQQQVNRAIQNGGSAVVFNPQTNTRIIYRVIYPSEVGGKGSTPSPKTPGRGRGGYSGRSRGRPRGRGWSRRVVEDDEHRSEGPDLTKEEKEEKKKHRPRTRSGRISKPPSYMVKDYKRIHHLDFDDDPYDDSDGGYSDYQVSDEDERRERKSLSSGYGGGRPRNYKCRTCGKQYIGRASLARHLRLYPDHGNASDVEEMSTHDENSNSSMSGHAQHSPASNPGTQGPPNRSRFSDMAAIRRKSRLREAIKVCSDEELMEIVMPRLAESVSLWEFLLMKSEKGDPPRPQVPDMLLNLEELLGEIQKLGRECLRAAETNQDGQLAEESLPHSGQYVKIEDEAVAHALALTTGLYAVLEENAPGQPQIRQRKRRRSSDGEKELAEVLAVGDVHGVSEVLGDSSIVEFVTPEEMVAALHGEPLPPNKRLRLDDSDGLVVLPAGAVSIDNSKSDGGDAIMEAALNSDSLSENMLENLEFAGLQAAAEEGTAEAPQVQVQAASAGTEDNAQQDQPTPQEQAQQQLQQTAETLRFVAVNPGQKIQILPGQSLLNRNFVRVVQSSEGPSSPVVQQTQPEAAMSQEAASAEESATIVSQENEADPEAPAEQVPADVEAGAAESEMIVAETPTSEPQECTSDGVSSSDAARIETMVQVVESHGDDDSEQELAQVVCAAEDAAPGGSAVVRQYLLPDGQIISAYEDGEGGLVQFTGGTEAEAEAETEEEATTSLGNVVIVQNPDGTTTLQVPNDGSIPIETVQALLAMDHSAMVMQASQEDAALSEGV